MISNRLPHPTSRLRLSAYIIGSLGVLAVLMPGATTAGAVQVAGAIDSVNIVETTSGLYDAMRLELAYSVPDSAAAGDTFTLKLPDTLRSASNGFDLRDSDGNLVTVATVRDGVATFTLTDYVNVRNDVSGTAWFDVRFNPMKNAPGDVVGLTFVTNGPTFNDTVNVSGAGAVDTTALFKYQVWANPDGRQDLDSPAGALKWGINSPRTPTSSADSMVVLVDTPRDGSAIDCGSVKFHQATGQNSRHELTGVSDIATDQTSFTCEPHEAKLTVTGVGSGMWIRMSGTSSVTDGAITSYANTATATIGASTTAITAFTPRDAAGGNGTGIAPVSTTAAPTPTTSSTVSGGSARGASVAATSTSPSALAYSVPTSRLAITGQSATPKVLLAIVLLVAGALLTFTPASRRKAASVRSGDRGNHNR